MQIEAHSGGCILDPMMAVHFQGDCVVLYEQYNTWADERHCHSDII